MDFRTPLDIANRVCQLCGVQSIGLEGFTEDSPQAFEIGQAYDKMRRVELRRNLWGPAIKHAVLRPVDVTSRLLQPVMWYSGTTYFFGALVTDAAGVIWSSKLPINLNRGPGYDTSAWELYCGPLAVNPYTSNMTYYAGEVVYKYAGDGSYTVYLSLISANADDPATSNAWDATATYRLGEVVTYSAVQYQSLVDLNLNQQPNTHAAAWSTVVTAGTGSRNWRLLSCALAPMNVIYPLGTGPGSQAGTRNIFRKPANYLRDAPQDPKAGSQSWLGMASALVYDDWLFEDDYIISSSTILPLRFGADQADVSKFDPMMSEGVALRIGVAVGKRLTQSQETLNEVKEQYGKFMSEARLTNGIEQGSTEPPLDDWITCRL